jgi:hypothetical protein
MATNNALSTTMTIRFPWVKTKADHKVVEPLIWWNSHYKSQHHFSGGRIEVLYDSTIRGYDSIKVASGTPAIVVACPYCKHKHSWQVSNIDGLKGQLKCVSRDCDREFGVHPRGNIFAVRDVLRKVQSSTCDKAKVLAWVRREAYYNDWDIDEDEQGVEITITTGCRPIADSFTTPEARASAIAYLTGRQEVHDEAVYSVRSEALSHGFECEDNE